MTVISGYYRQFFGAMENFSIRLYYQLGGSKLTSWPSTHISETKMISFVGDGLWNHWRDPQHRTNCERDRSSWSCPFTEIYGQGRWRKLKGFASVRLTEGTVHTAELHWYEAHGIGRKEIKIKFPLLD